MRLPRGRVRLSAPQVESFKRPDWEPLPYQGCVNVFGRVILDSPALMLAVLRFAEQGKIHEHAGANDALVACLEGNGFTKVGGVTAPLEAGQVVRWPAGIDHGLWTDRSTMTTLMVERPAG